MTYRAHFADGTSFDIDENTEAKFSHLNGQPVERWEFVGETPEGWKRDEHGNAPGAEPAATEAEPAAETAGTK